MQKLQSSFKPTILELGFGGVKMLETANHASYASARTLDLIAAALLLTLHDVISHEKSFMLNHRRRKMGGARFFYMNDINLPIPQSL